ncbi:hypothetical protein [Pontiella sp.]|uniref:hypothetical protein n=1 Tax=Pontiella sp. TaxID=2837462 RepID=UPI003564698E
MKFTVCISSLFLVLVSSPGEIHSFNFSGQVSAVHENESNTLGLLNVGDAFSGSFSYSDVVDSNTSTGQGVYNQQASLSLSLGSQEFDYDGYVYVRAWDNLADKDGFDFAVDDAFGDWSMWWFGFQLIDSTQTAYSDDSLPTSFDVSDFDNPLFRLAGSKLSTGEQFEVEMEVQDISPIPEPSTITLLGIASAIIWKVRKGRLFR